jgi:hypothetical protein
MKNLFYIYFLFVSISCDTLNCTDFPTNFSSYNVIKETIEQTSFPFYDSVDTSKSTWIKKAEFYSCNNVTGFLILSTKNKEYIFKDVPIEIWYNFKKAPSYGSYYHKFIRNKYFFYLNNRS